MAASVIKKPSARRYAHSEGATHICHDSKRRLVTCGCDGDVRIFEGVEDDCFDIATGCDTVTAVACYRSGDKDYAAIATGDYVVRTRCLDGSEDQLVMRFTASVNYLDISADQGAIAAGASDFVIRVLHLLQEDSRTDTLTGHEAPVLCVKFDPVGKFLASSSCDGGVRVWSVETLECVKVLPILSKCSDTSLAKSLCRLAWHPKGGKVLAIPVGEHVKVYGRDSWDCIGTLSDEHHRMAINVVAWSPSGDSLASGGADGAVVLWNYATRQPYMRCRNENGIGITSLAWGVGMGTTSGNVLAFGDNEGHIGTFEGVGVQREEPGRRLEDSLLMEGIAPDDIFDDNFDDDGLDSMFDREAAEVEEDGRGEGKREGENGEEEDEDVLGPRRRRSGEAITDNITDQGSLLGHEGPLLVPGEAAGSTTSKKPPAFSEKLLEDYITPFQCSATPEELEQRFMVYNLVGVVRSHVTDEVSMIEVEFHNVNTHHSFSIANSCGYTMAALSDQALALASRKSEDAHSQLFCTHFSSWDHSKDWTISMPSKENIVCIAIGMGWIAAATNKQMLRLFTVGGLQKETICVPGRIVTLGSHGDWLAIVYHSGTSTENVFTLHVWVLDVKHQKQLHPPHALPLSTHAKLEWIGFSDRGLLISYDSKGMVRALSSKYALTWIPVLDAGKPLGNKADHYFLVGMTHSPDELRCILCKEQNYPLTHPKPVMSSLPLKVPLCEPQLESSELEERYLQLDMLGTSGSSDVTKAAELMKGFALACKQNREFKAYELASLLPSEHSMKLALTYASKTSHVRLARYISELIQQRVMEAEGAGEEGSPDELEEERPAIRRERSDPSALVPAIRRERSDPEALVPERTTLGKVRSSNTEMAEQCGEVKGSGKVLRLVGRGTSDREHVGRTSRKGLGTSDETKDETKELFSDSESDEKQAPERTGEEDEKENSNAGEDEERPMSGSEATPKSPLYATPGSKRPNPFKMTTPVSKRIEKERSSSFLDNIAACVDEEQKLKEKKMKAKEKTEQSAKKTRKAVPKVAKSNNVQGTIKGGFFKQSKKPSEEDTLPPEDGKMSEAVPADSSVEPGVVQEKRGSKDKIALFAFKSKQ